MCYYTAVMACPWFIPDFRSPAPAVSPYPLGDLWSGRCSASGTATDGPKLQLCNFGYARDRCPHFTSGPDAVRFAIAASDDRQIEIRYCVEQNHHPHARGTLHYDRIAAAFTPTPEPALEAQSRAYIQSFLRRI